MKEHPIISKGEMVRAILDGRKTQMRRVIKPQPSRAVETVCNIGEDIWDLTSTHAEDFDARDQWKCPHGQPGDQLWVRETFQYVSDDNGPFKSREKGIHFENDEERFRIEYLATMGSTIEWDPPNFRPSIYMPRWASRITLEITDVKVERVQEITSQSVWFEGAPRNGTESVQDQRDWFEKLWNSIYEKKDFGFDKNPWVWVIEFKKIA